MKTSELMRPTGPYDAVIKQRKIDGEAFALKYSLSFVDVVCPGCGQKGEPAFEKFHFQHRICRNCQTLFCSPRPPEDLLGIFYNEYAAPQMWTELLLKADVARKALQYKPRAEKIMAMVTDNGGRRGGVAVDVGAGSGAFSLCLKELGFFEDVIALDLSRSCVQACQRQGLNARLGKVEDLSHDVADIICMNDLFEHLFDPLQFLVHCHGALRAGGFISIATPNGEGFDFKILKEATGNITPPEHLTYFNPASIALLLKRAGFEVVAVETPGKLDVEMILKERSKGYILRDKNEYLDFLFGQDVVVLENFQKFLAENRLSSHMLVLARKA